MKKLSKWDWIILCIIAIFVAVCLFWIIWGPKKNADKLVIEVDGKEYGTYNLDQDQMIEIKTNGSVSNAVIVENHSAYMQSANCPDHLCMKQGTIKYDGETIVCLPNRVVVMVKGDEKSEYDSVSK